MAQLKIVPVSYQRQRFIYVADTRGISIACVTRQQNKTQSTIFPSRQCRKRHIHVKKMREFYGKNSQFFLHRFIYFLSRMHKQLMRVQVAKEEIQQIYIKKVQKVVYPSKENPRNSRKKSTCFAAVYSCPVPDTKCTSN